MQAPLISSVRIQGLFGCYTYDLPTDGSFHDAAILYGDNGAGKSTILRLIFHLLSAADNRGHRTALYDTPFEVLEVRLASGVVIKADRISAPPALILSVKEDGATVTEWNFLPHALRTEGTFSAEASAASERSGASARTSSTGASVAARRRRSPEDAAYLAAVRTRAPVVFILNAERRLDSDMVADPSDEVELRRFLHYQEPSRVQDVALRAREIALSQALAAAARWMTETLFHSANQGSTNVHSVYAEVVRHLVVQPSRNEKASEPTTAAALTIALDSIERRAAEYAAYELTTTLPMAEFKAALSVSATATRELVAGLLEPYIKSLESRLDALKSAYAVLHRFVTTVNSFLWDKKISFSPASGFSVVNRTGTKLEPAQLSSGEQQILLLLCYVLVTRDQASVFIIDEPEISLNIKWQRQLVQSLLDLTSGANIQFLFASHSMELLAQHRDRVVALSS